MQRKFCYFHLRFNLLHFVKCVISEPTFNFDLLEAAHIRHSKLLSRTGLKGTFQSQVRVIILKFPQLHSKDHQNC